MPRLPPSFAFLGSPCSDLLSTGSPSRYPVCRNAPGNTPSPLFEFFQNSVTLSASNLRCPLVLPVAEIPKYRNALWTSLPMSGSLHVSSHEWTVQIISGLRHSRSRKTPFYAFRCLNPRNGDLATRVLLPDGRLRFLSLFRDFHCEVPRSLVIRASEILNSRNLKS
jgi:hypothetical protein